MILGGAVATYAAPKLSLYLDDKKQSVAVKKVGNQNYIALKDVSKLYGGSYSYDSKTGKNKLKTKSYLSGDKKYTVNKTFKGDNFQVKVNNISALKNFKGRTSDVGKKAILLDVTFKNTSNQYINYSDSTSDERYRNYLAFVFNTNEKAFVNYNDSTYDSHNLAPNESRKATLVVYVEGNINKLNSFYSYIQFSVGAKFKNDTFFSRSEDVKLDVKFR